jgi:hypothetical protein
MEDKSTAVEILTDAAHCVGGGRSIHGDVNPSFEMIAEMWTVYIGHSIARRHNGTVKVDANDVLEMMSIMKKCRHVYSPEVNRENFVDDAGYTALAGMVVGAASKRPSLPRISAGVDAELEGDIRSIATRLRPSNV